jgi:hypothetical protein
MQLRDALHGQGLTHPGIIVFSVMLRFTMNCYWKEIGREIWGRDVGSMKCYCEAHVQLSGLTCSSGLVTRLHYCSAA